MKLHYVGINTEEVSKPFLSIVSKLFRQVANPDTEIDIKSVNPGLERITDVHPYLFFLSKRQIVEKIVEAEKQGYDAVMVRCFLGPGVSEARGIVHMPAIGLGESAIHFACLLGRGFGVVTADEPPVISEIEDEIRFYGLQGRIIARPVRGISMPSREVFTKGLQNPKIVAEDILQKAKECVEEGANVVIVGCNGLAPHFALRQRWLG